MKIGIGLSGGSTKGAFHMGALEALISNKAEVKAIYGISVGALIALPAGLALIKRPNYFNALRDKFLDLSITDIFEEDPFSVFNVVISVFRDRMSSMGPLKTNLSKLVPEREFYCYKHEQGAGRAPKIMIGVYNVSLLRMEYKSIIDLVYEEWLEYTVAACSIPVFAPFVKINGYLYADGGIYDHNPSHELIKNEDIDICISSYTRQKNKTFKPSDQGGILKLLSRIFDTFSMLLYSISKSDEADEDEIAMLKNISIKRIYAEDIKSGWYITDRKIMRSILYDGYQKATKLLQTIQDETAKL